METTSHSLAGRFTRFLTAGYTLEASLQEFRKAILINLLILCGNVFMALLGILAAVQGNVVLATADFTALLVLDALALWLHRSRRVDQAGNAMLIFGGLFYLFLFVSGGVQGTAYVWCYTYPLATIFLTGTRRGSTLALILLAATVSLWATQAQIGLQIPYSANLIYRYAASYVTILLFAAFMEKVREYTHEKMETARERLQATVEKLESAQEKLRELAVHDDLTGLYNRRFLNEMLGTMIKQANRTHGMLGVLMIDIDHFKAYNDNLGHPQGDLVLQKVAKILESCLRRQSDMVFRYGGEEFVVLLTNASRLAAKEMADLIVARTRETKIPHPESPAGILTASVGVAVWCPNCAEDGTSLIDCADQAMYRAKKNGRNRVEAHEQTA